MHYNESNVSKIKYSFIHECSAGVFMKVLFDQVLEIVQRPNAFVNGRKLVFPAKLGSAATLRAIRRPLANPDSFLQ